MLELSLSLLLVLIGCALLYIGGDMLVSASAFIANRVGMSPIAIGATVAMVNNVPVPSPTPGPADAAVQDKDLAPAPTPPTAANFLSVTLTKSSTPKIVVGRGHRRFRL